jgi:transglutaminase-like putative cysteine protease
MLRGSLGAGLLLGALALPLSSAGPLAGREKGEPKVALPTPKKARTFELTYSATVTGLKPGQAARVWLPVASDKPGQQQAKIVKKVLPAKGKVGREPVFGNHILFVEAQAGPDGKVPLELTYAVKRFEVKGAVDKLAALTVMDLARFLRADALVPITGKPLELIKGKKLPEDVEGKARLFYDVVNRHMKYSKKGTGWGRGDSVWACDSKYGNCSDFHSLFLSLARSQKVPAKFEIGFPLPAKRGAGQIGGYHCWAFFRVEGKGWVPVDISEANKDPGLADYYFGNLTPDRVTFSTGRDLDLVPRQAGKPLNFFVYPYVEVDGKPWPQEKITTKFSYRDVKKE